MSERSHIGPFIHINKPGMRTHAHTTDTKTAIGYIRVSTQEQATEGVTLDAQRDRLRAYCKLHAIKLIDNKADEAATRSPEMVPPRMGTKTKKGGK